MNEGRMGRERWGKGRKEREHHRQNMNSSVHISMGALGHKRIVNKNSLLRTDMYKIRTQRENCKNKNNRTK
jgi:hypothetical protein